MLPLESCLMTSGFRLSLEPVDTGREAAGILESSRRGACLLTARSEALRPRLMGTMLRRRAERAMRSVAILDGPAGLLSEVQVRGNGCERASNEELCVVL